MAEASCAWRASDEAGKQLSLTDDVRPALIRQEESIIFAMIERSQFRLNASCYQGGEKSVLSQRVDFIPEDPSLSLMDYFLLETERYVCRNSKRWHRRYLLC